MMTPHIPTRSSHAAILRKLALSTALAGSLALPSVARAQNNTPGAPSVGPVTGGSAPTFNGGSGATLSGNATNLDVDLRAQSTVINWNRFNIAEGSKVDFGTGLAGNVAVLNRVTGGGATNIQGALTSDANVSVFLVNPNGIMISGKGSVSTGSFVASTLGIRDQDFADGKYIFSASNGAEGITVNGRITTRGTGIGLILLGRSVISRGELNSGTQDTALVAADDVTLNYTAGSPLGIQITSGTNVERAMNIVGGTIEGRNVYFAMATRGSLTNSLLQIDGDVRAVNGDKGIVIVGGRSAIDPNVTVSGAGTSNGVEVAVEGSLTSLGAGAGAGIRIGGTDAVTVSGAVNSAGSYTVRGESVTLGADNTSIRQQANGAVSIIADEGTLRGRGNLELSADVDGSGSQALRLTADGTIDFGSGTLLESGGAGLVSAVEIFSKERNDNVLLGNVRALTLDGGLIGSALEGGLIRAAGGLSGNGGEVRAGTVALGGAATIGASTLTLGSLSAAGNVTLSANAMRVGSVASMGGTATLDAGSLRGLTTNARTDVSAAVAVSIDVDNNALLGRVASTGGAVALTAGSFDANEVVAETGATLVTRSGDAQLRSLTVRAGSASLTASDDAAVLGPVLVGGDYAVTGDAVQLRGNQAATGAVTVTARSGAIGSTDSLVLTANSDGVGTEALTLRGRANLSIGSTLNGGAAQQSAVVVDTALTNDVALGNVNAATLTVAGGAPLLGNLTLGSVTTTGDLSLNSLRAINAVGLRSTGGLVGVRADTIDVGSVNAATGAQLSGRTIAFDVITAATAEVAATGLTGTRFIDGGTISTSGGTTVTSGGGTVEIDGVTALGDLSVTSAGATTLGTLQIGGAATVTTTGGANDITIITLNAAGAASINGARDIIAASLASSGGALTVSAGGNVRGLGTGGRAALSAATDLTLTAGGNAGLGAVSGNTLSLQAGATLDSQSLSGSGGIQASAAGGDLIVRGLTTTSGNATLSASGTANVSGPVTVVGDYSVAGANVLLGGTHLATGAVDVTARSGSISSDPAMALTANSDGIGAEALTLHGGTNLAADSVLRGGPNRQSQVVLDAAANVPVRLGNVDASSLSIAGGASLGGSLNFGKVVTNDNITLQVAGGINGGELTSLNGAVSLTGAGGATVSTLAGATVDVAMQGTVDVARATASAGSVRLASAGNAVRLGTASAALDVVVQAAGTASVLDAVSAGRDYRVRGSAVTLGGDPDAELQSSAGTLDITATSGAITGGTGLTLRSGTGALILDGAGGIDLRAGVLQLGPDGTGVLGLRAGSGQTIDLGTSVTVGTIGSVTAGHDAVASVLTHAGALRFGTLNAANPVDIRLTGGGALTGSALNGAGTVAIDVGGGIVDVGSIDAAKLTVSGGSIMGSTYKAAGDITLSGGTITLTELDSTAGSATATATAGTLSVDRAHAALDLALTTTGAGNVSVGNASAGGNVSLIARNGDVLNDSATAGGTLTLSASGDIAGRSGTSPDLSGQDVVLTVGRNITTGTITSPGGLSITASSITVGRATAGRALSLNASNGDLSVGSASAGGAIAFSATRDVTVGTLESGAGVSLDAGRDLYVRGMTAPGGATVRAGGRATLDSANVGGLDVEAGIIDAGALVVGGTTRLVATIGGVQADLLDAAGAATLTANTDVTVLAWRTPSGLTVTAGNNAALGTGTAGALEIEANNVSITDAVVTGAAKLRATGNVSAGTLTSGSIAAAVGGELAIDRLTTGAAVLQGGSTRLGTATIDTLRITGGSATLADVTVAGAVGIDVTGSVAATRLRGGEVTLRGANVLADTLVSTGAATLISTAGAVDLGELTGNAGVTINAAGNAIVDAWTTGALSVSATGDVALGTGTSSGLTVSGGSIGITDATVTGGANLIGTRTVTVGKLTSSELGATAGGALAIDQLKTGAAVLNADSTRLGTATLDTLRITGGSATLTDVTVSGAVGVDVTGAVNASRLSGGEVTLQGASVAANTLVATGSAMLTSTAGPVDLGQLTGNAAVTIAAAGNAEIDGWSTGALSVTTTGDVTLGTGMSSGLTVTGGSIGITDATVTGGATLNGTRTVTVGKLASGETNATAGSALAIDQLKTGAAVLKAATTRLGTLNAATLTVTGGSASLTDGTVTGLTSIDVTETANVARLSGGELSLLSGGLATLGTVTTTGAATVRAGDVTLDGQLRASSVTIGTRAPDAGLRLGAAADVQGAGIGLSEAEVGRIDTDRVVFDGGTGKVTIGTLAFAAATGRSRVDVLTTGDVLVNGEMSGSGAGRLFRIGGTDTSDSAMASSIRIVATSDAGGRLLFQDAAVELRGARIALGQSGLTDALFAGGGISAEEAGTYIGNANSPLYSAFAGGSAYIPGSETTLSAGRLTLRFDDFALFQNTGTRGFNTGAVLGGVPGGGPTLNLIGPGNGAPTAFAIFGTINGVSGTSTAVLGQSVITTTGIDFAAARVNGCVLGTGAGCLTTTISQPTLNVFDPGRLVVFRAEADFTLPFDPVIGSNNEALFAGVGAVADPAADCPPEQAGCSPAQQNQE